MAKIKGQQLLAIAVKYWFLLFLYSTYYFAIDIWNALSGDCKSHLGILGTQSNAEQAWYDVLGATLCSLEVS